ncbi:MAG: ABC transporter ATP-binding protein, partial [Planctomycetaceae bacterium]|nr:ABC transporter ATP-binding protein [Planctomycetaceae bacterium]
MSAAIVVTSVSHRYGERLALNDVSFDVAQGEIFGLLGPNGGGKSTLLKILSTLLPLQTGSIQLAGFDLASRADAIRHTLAVTFQHPSLDIKLTVGENLRHQGHLYGLSGQILTTRIQKVMSQLNIADRERDYAETLSGGLKRRVEIAKCLLHNPAILLLDEPSTGLDPAARNDLWNVLSEVRQEENVTVLVTTHLMEEADRCDRLGILDHGQLIALGAPSEIRSTVGGNSITIDPLDILQLISEFEQQNIAFRQVGGEIRIEDVQSTSELTRLIDTYSQQFRSITLGKPSLEDAFIKLTGRRISEDTTDA